MKTVFEIQAALKNYEWGKIGLNSVVAQFQKAAFSNFVVEEIPYSELWMGTHCSGPSFIPLINNVKLRDWIIGHPECLGENILKFHNAVDGLPFLFKVLSVGKALSIQVHPDKEAAIKLHKQFPEHYPDDNHKPEMAIALTDFEALCGFRPLQEIKDFVLAIPQLKRLVGEEIHYKFVNMPSESNLKCLFTALMMCPASTFQPELNQIVEDFNKDAVKNNLCRSIQELFLKIALQYPGDIGCFCLFFLNYLKLNPGEAIFLAANEPHAYLYGDCIECMACSDNVVRAGLTPKFKDIQTLCEMLTYKSRTVSENIFSYENHSEDPYLKIYQPPVKEFAVDVISLPASCKSYFLRSINSASILLVTEGKAIYKYNSQENNLGRGSILFISSGTIISLYPEAKILMFRAYCNS